MKVRGPVLPQLAIRLREIGYTPEALKDVLGVASPDDVGLLNHAPALQRLADQRSQVATAMRLLFLEADEADRTVTAALSPRVCDNLVNAGVLLRRGSRVCARVRIDAVGDQYLIADRRFRTIDRRALGLRGRDPVYPPSSDSLMLRDAIIAGNARHVLDLCTGSGVQALHCARQAERVVGVDINPRAAAVARLNAQFNGVGNVEVRVGDVYGPVRAAPFDLIIANPPFVASPYANAPAYHAGGPRGDRVLRRIISGLGRHLSAGGRAFAISHLALREGEEVRAVAGRWFRDFPGRALVLVLETGTPVDLAAAQALFALHRGLGAYATEVKRWVDYLRRCRVAAVLLLLVVAERRAPRAVEVVAAQPRVLPIPLGPSPADRIAAWLGAQ